VVKIAVHLQAFRGFTIRIYPKLAMMGRSLLLCAVIATTIIDLTYGFSTTNAIGAVPSMRHGRITTIPHMALRPPPGRKGFLIGLRESIAYIRDGKKFIEERTNEFGPIFSTSRESHHNLLEMRRHFLFRTTTLGKQHMTDDYWHTLSLFSVFFLFGSQFSSGLQSW
jgi:hypothetical protein